MEREQVPKITICGGPEKSIQVNSPSALVRSPGTGTQRVDLSHAGPDDPGDCSAGTGGDFGTFGGPGTAYQRNQPWLRREIRSACITHSRPT